MYHTSEKIIKDKALNFDQSLGVVLLRMTFLIILLCNKDKLPKDKITEFFQNPINVAQALQLRNNVALLKHKQAGNPVCE